MKTTKNYFSYLFLALTLAFSLGLTSCSDDEENVGSKEDLIGTWQYTYYEWTESGGGDKDSGYEDYADNTTTLTFKEDGTAIESDKYKNSVPSINYYTWSYKGNKLKFKYESSSYGDDPSEDGSSDNETFTVTTLTSSKLVMEVSYKEKEEGVTYQSHEIYTLKKISE